MTRTTDTMDLEKAEARLPRWMLALAGAGTVGILLFARLRFGAGFAIGSGLGILNYIWLHNIVEALVNAGSVRPPKSALFKVIIRYPLMLAGVFLFYETGWLPVAAVLAGLFVPVGGVLIEAVVLLCEGMKVSVKG
jgi:hypothetical protein